MKIPDLSKEERQALVHCLIKIPPGESVTVELENPKRWWIINAFSESRTGAINGTKE